MQQQRPSGPPGVAQGVQQQIGVGNWLAVVGEGNDPGVGQLAHLGQLFTFEVLADRTHLAHSDDGFSGRLVEHPGGDWAGIDHRVGVGHPYDGHVSPGGSRHGPRGQIFLVFVTWGAQMGMRIDESGEHPAAGQIVEHLHVGGSL